MAPPDFFGKVRNKKRKATSNDEMKNQIAQLAEERKKKWQSRRLAESRASRGGGGVGGANARESSTRPAIASPLPPSKSASTTTNATTTAISGLNSEVEVQRVHPTSNFPLSGFSDAIQLGQSGSATDVGGVGGRGGRLPTKMGDAAASRIATKGPALGKENMLVERGERVYPASFEPAGPSPPVAGETTTSNISQDPTTAFPTNAGVLEPGTEVETCLMDRRGKNGLAGVIVDYDHINQRYNVELENGVLMPINIRNLRKKRNKGKAKRGDDANAGNKEKKRTFTSGRLLTMILLTFGIFLTASFYLKSSSNNDNIPMNGAGQQFTKEQQAEAVEKALRASKYDWHYEVLDIPEDSSEADVKKAYRRKGEEKRLGFFCATNNILSQNT